MKIETMFLVKEKEGFSKDFSILVSMMNYARFTTIEDVKNLSIEELDYRCHDEANSIGMLLAHMAAVEKIYQKLTFEELTDEELEEYAESLQPALDLGVEVAMVLNGKPIEVYIEELNITRQKTYEYFTKQNDDWLYKETDWWYRQKGNNFFKWYHVFEDEINHRGQIRVLKKLYQKQSTNLH